MTLNFSNFYNFSLEHAYLNDHFSVDNHKASKYVCLIDAMTLTCNCVNMYIAAKMTELQ